MNYIIKRLGFYVLAFWGAVTLNFFLGRELKRGPGPFGLMQMDQMHNITIEEMSKIGINIADPNLPKYFQQNCNINDDKDVLDLLLNLTIEAYSNTIPVIRDNEIVLTK